MITSRRVSADIDGRQNMLWYVRLPVSSAPEKEQMEQELQEKLRDKERRCAPPNLPPWLPPCAFAVKLSATDVSVRMIGMVIHKLFS